DVHVVPPPVVTAQVEAVLDDLPVAAVKTGMLATREIVEVVADLAAAERLPNLVVDPVMVASSGARLLTPDAEEACRRALLPHAVVATPNVHEAEVLLGVRIRTLDDQRDAARRLAALGVRHVVVKGGHAVADAGRQATDVLADRDTGHVRDLVAPRLPSRNTHGSGCTFASAVAAGLALG
ncbi:MAG: hydroxymethylpyrimidine/phosphomethylpyrimidine kinase, partial [Gemmatimonadetes bacterium]|nr:hydroxymethylpyrimidine/phosphomethylpyrimidine kinase [Gemmatimonadota bacterium]NIR35206.1 hydroxymethylpyrimidine/phosphomethylpyrimidine kinase [Actinomycetota bacterium]NIS29328.1 hydroxymethylpyrimidine/phosphomethylpyrimidine kinase [Actinomycetota bacterium]NIU64707.1 hydroxymethylpyrimidine/phosphomethylpyrimidine kinase [Actinomycetota bacterium]NIW26502.1 bifunctional hydroxymethylpyrimidine kinase/phosphomethylpyrimidine kinase [Actinomycetota bacterium]